MGEAQPVQTMTVAEYLEWEPVQMEKYQYIHGEVFAMGGASSRNTPCPCTAWNWKSSGTAYSAMWISYSI